ncbi:MAG: glycoside hydrolase family 38 C-terminal domain-containing protein [Sphaerochaeta sp.]|nr:glycoside hydrolase family 38 C-terminal domain-containing protein [Sphaerochaeta sp.]
MEKTMYMIGNAHLDPVWLWDWKEGYAENNATMKSMLDRLDEYDDIYFTSSSSLFYEWIEESSPLMFEAIRKRVAEGRWYICGGWYVQPDCNLPSGESFARHTLYAQNYFFSKFGCIASIGYCVDSFGHCGTLPQILRQSRMDKYVFMRPGRHEKPIGENLFIWESPDGSQVTAYRIPFNYNAHFGVEKQIDDCMNEFTGDFPGVMAFYGVGNHGGGPTIANIQTILEMRKKYPDVALEFATPAQFFSDVAKSGVHLPVIKEDLQHHASGCYSVHSEVKRMNRKAENQLLRGEKYAVIAHQVLGTPYTSEGFDQAWKNVLFNQFHDILAGTCLRSAYEDARDAYGEAKAIASRLENRAVQALSWAIDIPHVEHSIPIVVFNPHGWATESFVEVEGGHHKNMLFPEHPVLYDAHNKRIDFQILDAAVHCRGRVRLVFNAELPPLGYGLYMLCEEKEARAIENNPVSDSLVLENNFLKVEFSADTGGIGLIYDKRADRSLLSSDAAIGTVVKDTSDTWGHATITYHDVLGQFKPVRMEKTESGPVRETVRVYSTYDASYLIQEFMLYKGADYLTVKAKVFWTEQLKALRLDFPVEAGVGKVTYEIPFGTIEKKANGEEEPMQNWFDLCDEDGRGICIVNDGKYSGAAFGNTLSLLVLRSPVYSHHVPTELELPLDRYDFIDQGEQFFEYRIIPHGKKYEHATFVKSGLELNQKPIVLFETYHEGTLARSHSYMGETEENVVLTCLKKAHVGSGYVARFQETDGKSCTSLISFFGNPAFELSFKSFEIKTIRLDLKGSLVEELDFLEWKAEE